MMKKVVITPIGKALYRGPGEFDRSSRGVHSSAVSNFYPYPSTVAGLLSWLVKADRKRGVRKLGSGDWVSKYKEMLGENPLIYGPFYRVEEEYYVVYDLRNKKRMLIPIKLDGVNKYEVIYKYEYPGEIDTTKLIKERKIDSGYYQDRIGIRLDKTSNNKTVERGGGLYTVRFFHPESISMDLQYVYFIDNIDLKNRSIVSRFGGEGSVASISISETETLDEVFNIGSARFIGLYVLSPILIPTDQNVYTHLSNEISNCGFELRRVIGESTLLGAGFSSIPIGSSGSGFIRRRRPIYNAVKPGSILYVEPGENYTMDALKKLCMKGLGVGREVGFGKLIPFQPISSGE